MQLLVVIPTYNCKLQIVRMLKSLQNIQDNDACQILIVDNHSQDGTARAAIATKNEIGISNLKVCSAIENNNLGGTIKIAFNEAKSRRFDFVAILHGDDQAEVRDLFEIWERIKCSPKPSTVLGSRFQKESKLVGYSKVRIFGNLVLNFIYSIVLRSKLSDLGSGLNVYKVSDITDLEYMKCSNSLYFNYQLIILMIKNGLSFEYHPITWKESDQKTNAKNIRIFLSALKVLFESSHGLKSAPDNRVYGLRILENE